jgi:hypothetical protein
MDCGVLLSVLFGGAAELPHLPDRRELPTPSRRGNSRRSREPASGQRFSESDLTFLESLFRLGDEVRFGSRSATRPELIAALRGVGELVDRMEAASC